MSLNDQFEHSRIPLKPLPYQNRRLADCNEIMIDYLGDNPTYHIYIVDSSDKTKYIDITSLILKASVGDSIQVNIDGMEEAISLNDLLSYIYKNFVFPENKLGFVYGRDKDLLFDPETKTVLLRDTDGTAYTPVVKAESVFDSNGRSIQERLDSMCRLGFSMDYVRTNVEDQNTITITYPFLNYLDGGNFYELRIGTVFVDRSRYQAIENTDEDGNAYGATITFFQDKLEINRRIDILYIYNCKDVGGDVNNTVISGGSIARNSISSSKLEKVTDDYYTNDSTCIASAKSVYNLFNDLSNSIASSQNKIIWAKDTSTSAGTITVNITAATAELNVANYPVLLNVVTNTSKNTSVKLTLTSTYNGSNVTIANAATIKLSSDVALKNNLPANHMMKIIIVDSTTAYLVAIPETDWDITRYIYTCADQEIDIPFSGMSYTIGAKILVYRNGVRLFEDLDYSINYANETIRLYVRTEEGERIVFEAISLM